MTRRIGKAPWQTIVGWMLSLAGFATFVWACYIDGSPPLITWSAFLPELFAPTNVEGEAGMLVSIIGDGLLCWQPFRRMGE